MSGKPKSGGGEPPASRPWDWPDRQPYTLALKLGAKLGKDGVHSALGWAALGHSPQGFEQGEMTFREGQTFAEKIAETVTQYEMLARKHGPSKVRLYRYTSKSWPRSRPFQEGMTLAEHTELVDATAKALRQAGAEVETWTV